MIHELKKVDISFEELNITIPKILRKLHYKKNDAPKEIVEAINNEIEFVINSYEFNAGYIISDQFSITNNIKIKGIEFQVGRELIGIMKNANYHVLFLSTAGSEIVKRNKKLSKKSMILESYINDVLGNTIVESGSDVLLKKIKKAYYPLKTTNRYSPGNCGWEDMNQKSFFSLFPDNFLGVSLTDSQMMVPVKTINGMIGIGFDIEYRSSNCSNCNSQNCIYRKTEFIS